MIEHILASVGAAIIVLGMILGVIINSTPYRRSKDQRSYVREKPQFEPRSKQAEWDRIMGVRK